MWYEQEVVLSRSEPQTFVLVSDTCDRNECVCFGVSSPGEILKLGGGDKFGDSCSHLVGRRELPRGF